MSSGTRRVVLVALVAAGFSAAFPVIAEEGNLTGKWSVRMGAEPLQTLELEQSGEKLRGKLWTGDSSHVPIEGTVHGPDVSFGVPRDMSKGGVAPWFTGRVNGNRIEGSVTIGPGQLPFEATRS